MLKICGKQLKNLWTVCEKCVENLWKTFGLYVVLCREICSTFVAGGGQD